MTKSNTNLEKLTCTKTSPTRRGNTNDGKLVPAQTIEQEFKYSKTRESDANKCTATMQQHQTHRVDALLPIPLWASEGTLVGPGKDTHGTPVPLRMESVGGPTRVRRRADARRDKKVHGLVQLFFQEVSLTGSSDSVVSDGECKQHFAPRASFTCHTRNFFVCTWLKMSEGCCLCESQKSFCLILELFPSSFDIVTVAQVGRFIVQSQTFAL